MPFGSKSNKASLVGAAGIHPIFSTVATSYNNNFEKIAYNQRDQV